MFKNKNFQKKMKIDLKNLNIEHFTNFIQSLKDSQIDPYLVLKFTSLTLGGLTVTYLGKVWYSYQFFKQRGLQSPEHEFFYGNFRQINKNKNYSEKLREWTQKYGKTYGYFEGHLPVIVTSDLDFIQEVFVKQSTNFSARKKGNLTRKDDDPNSDLFLSTKTRWKRMRMIMNPTFSQSKLRELGPVLLTCVDRLIEVLNQESQKELNMSQYFKRFTMDSIWSCAFGVDINMQFEKENEYFNKCEEVFKLSAHLNTPQYLGVYFHEFKEILLQFIVFSMKILSKVVDPRKLLPFFWLRMKVGEIVERRLEDQGSKKKDYIQLLLDASSDFENEKNFSYSDVKKILTPKEVEANLILFMLAGYETTSTALSYSAHVLSTCPEEQTRLYDEITATYGQDLSSINSDNIQDLQYLDWFVKEVLRYFPIGNSVVARRCTKATTVNGLDIPLDTPISVDVLSIHFDSELWGPVDPNVFYPPRHEVKRNPLGFMAFGNGPRYCIGIKFALIELKMALVKIIHNFEVLPSDDAKFGRIDYEEGIVRYPKNGVNVLLKKRHF
nr:cytochrome P450 3045C3/4 [Brachionus rubens]